MRTRITELFGIKLRSSRAACIASAMPSWQPQCRMPAASGSSLVCRRGSVERVPRSLRAVARGHGRACPGIRSDPGESQSDDCEARRFARAGGGVRTSRPSCVASRPFASRNPRNKSSQRSSRYDFRPFACPVSVAMSVRTNRMIAIPVAINLRPVAMISRLLGISSCNHRAHDPPMIAIPGADDCRSLHVTGD